MSLIKVSHLTFGYEGSPDYVFEDVSFQMDSDWCLGFTGRNGRGKTTFLKLLMGEYPHSGEITAAQTFRYFPFPVSDRRRMTLDVVHDLCPEFEDWMLIRELSLLGMDAEPLYRLFETLSPGEQTKVQLAALFLGENQFLLIDEPTNHLDADGRRSIGEYLRQKKGFILVSHDRTLLDLCTDHTLSILASGAIEIQHGTFSEWARRKDEKDRANQEKNERLKKDIQRLESSAEALSKWSDQGEKRKYGRQPCGLPADRGYVGHKAAKLMRRSTQQMQKINRAVEEKEGLLTEIEETGSLKIFMNRYPKQTLIRANDLSLYYGTRKVAGCIAFEVHQGDRIAVVGPNGCGKSTLLRLICGEPVSYSGQLSVGSGLQISHVSQDTSSLKGTLRAYAQTNGLDETLFKTILRKMGFERTQLEKHMETFSEGQKKKVLLAGSLSSSAHLYIWDEPLNYLDVITRMQLETLLVENQATMLFVEHDAVFRDRVATKYISF
ncbi:MAG: ABC-F type ribosomal protection protein [Clostridia bacterium]|nr:ABC-F type ribosomal protection protein [Clostridia bacterium]